MKQVGQYLLEYESSQELQQDDNAILKVQNEIRSRDVVVGWIENLSIDPPPGREGPSNSLLRPWVLTEAAADVRSEVE